MCRVCVSTRSLSCVQLFATRWTLAFQAPLPTEFSRQEYWSGLLFPSPGYLTEPGVKPVFLVSPVMFIKQENEQRAFITVTGT